MSRIHRVVRQHLPYSPLEFFIAVDGLKTATHQ